MKKKSLKSFTAEELGQKEEGKDGKRKREREKNRENEKKKKVPYIAALLRKAVFSPPQGVATFIRGLFINNQMKTSGLLSFLGYCACAQCAWVLSLEMGSIRYTFKPPGPRQPDIAYDFRCTSGRLHIANAQTIYCR